MILNLKSNYMIKSAIAQIKKTKKQSKLTCESIPSENPDIKKKQNLNQNKTSLAKRIFSA